jgi:hypothetical protein
MEAVKIKEFVDKVIMDRLPIYGYDGTREHLYNTILGHKEIVKQKMSNNKFTFEPLYIEKLTGRTKYLAYYVFYGQKRVIDLFSIENRMKNLDGRNYSPEKAFKALLFKEKINGVSE